MSGNILDCSFQLSLQWINFFFCFGPKKWNRRSAEKDTSTERLSICHLKILLMKVKMNIKVSPHVCVDGLCEGPVPVIDHAVDLWLDQQLSPLTGLQLGEGKSALLHLFQSVLIKMITFRSTLKLDCRYLDDMFLAGLVLGGPVHRPPSQINCELGLRLVAAKLLKSKKQSESPCLTQRLFDKDLSLGRHSWI